jgi:hypothetical protein
MGRPLLELILFRSPLHGIDLIEAAEGHLDPWGLRIIPNESLEYFVCSLGPVFRQLHLSQAEIRSRREVLGNMGG